MNYIELEMLKNSAIRSTADIGNLEHPEYLRTLKGIELFNAMCDDQKEKFSHMSESMFSELRSKLLEKFKTEEKREVLRVYLLINDIGKLPEVQNMTNLLDHDVALVAYIKNNKEKFPSFYKLSDVDQNLILNCFDSGFNLGQIIQAESVSKDFEKLNLIQNKDLYLWHAFFDIGGATAHINYDTAPILNDSFAQTFLTISNLQVDALAYKQFVVKTAAESCKLENISYWEARLLMQSRFNVNLEMLLNLDNQTRWILEKELLAEDIMVYYAPALLSNLKYTRDSYQLLARIYQETRIYMIKKGIKNTVVEVNELAKSKTAVTDKFVFVEKADGLILKLLKPKKITNEVVEKARELLDYPRNTLFVGIGGGTDVVQASILAELTGNKNVLSIRGAYTASTSVREKREILNPEKKINDAIFKIDANTDCVGRFVEAAPLKIAKDVYIVLDDENPQNLEENITQLLTYLNVQKVVLVDTGGDVLFNFVDKEDESVFSTPDQDIRVLQAFQNLNINFDLLVVAPGIDSPENYSEIEYSVIEFDTATKEKIITMYQEMEMDKFNKKCFGKTSFIFQEALKNSTTHLYVCPLPEDYVTDNSNPWNPFIIVNGYMAEVIKIDIESEGRLYE